MKEQWLAATGDKLAACHFRLMFRQSTLQTELTMLHNVPVPGSIPTSLVSSDFLLRNKNVEAYIAFTQGLTRPYITSARLHFRDVA